MDLTVITPVYNEEKCIRIFLERLKKVLDEIKDITSWQLVFVNDGSSDSSFRIIREEQKKDQRIKLISFSRNFGYQAALLAGLTELESDLYTIVDVDCEDPPELLKTFFEKIKEDYQLVYGIRSQRKEPAFLYLGRKLFYKLNSMVADSRVIMWMAEFSMFTKSMRDAILKPNTTYPFLRTELAYVGFKICGVDYVRQKRIAGESHYNLLRMTKFAIAAILAGTTFPLRAILYLSLVTVGVFILCMIPASSLSHLSSCAVILGFFYLLIVAPLLGLYIARTYKNVVGRSVYIIDSERTFL